MQYALISAISLALIAFFLFYPYAKYRTDRCRQQLFAVRDELFDEAMNGRIRFDSQAYRATRRVFNGAIRFAHQISFSRMIAFRFIGRSRDDLQHALNSASAEDRELCMQYLQRADVIVMNYVLTSPFVIMFLFPQVVVLLLGRIGVDVAAWIVKLCRKQFAEFNRIAFMEGRA